MSIFPARILVATDEVRERANGAAGRIRLPRPPRSMGSPIFVRR